MNTATRRGLDFSTVDFERVARVASVVSISEVTLRWFRGHRTLGVADVPKDWATHAFMGWGADLAGLSDAFFVANVTLGVGFKLGLGPDVSDESSLSDVEPDLEMVASFDLTYEVGRLKPYSEEDLPHFCQFNGTFNAWPYLREWLQSTSVQLGVAAFVLPTFRVPPLATGAKET